MRFSLVDQIFPAHGRSGQLRSTDGNSEPLQPINVINIFSVANHVTHNHNHYCFNLLALDVRHFQLIVGRFQAIGQILFRIQGAMQGMGGIWGRISAWGRSWF